MTVWRFPCELHLKLLPWPPRLQAASGPRRHCQAENEAWDESRRQRTVAEIWATCKQDPRPNKGSRRETKENDSWVDKKKASALFPFYLLIPYRGRLFQRGGAIHPRATTSSHDWGAPVCGYQRYMHARPAFQLLVGANPLSLFLSLALVILGFLALCPITSGDTPYDNQAFELRRLLVGP